MKKVILLSIALFFVIGSINSRADNKVHPMDFKGNPDLFVLYQNYPNPFNPTTVISYNLKADASVKLIVYNLVGQAVKIVIDEYQTKGYKEYSFDATQLPAGIYLYKLQVGNYSSVKRMTLVK
ncbi:MAG: T9SS type A sorting domain-containing protein [Ignavibacteria bacterium]